MVVRRGSDMYLLVWWHGRSPPFAMQTKSSWCAPACRQHIGCILGRSYHQAGNYEDLLQAGTKLNAPRPKSVEVTFPVLCIVSIGLSSCVRLMYREPFTL